MGNRRDHVYLDRLFLIGATVLLSVALLLPARALAAIPTATEWIPPIGVWNVTTAHGELLSTGFYHMGVDAGWDIGVDAPVYASADGIVREVQERTQFGLVILIEHRLPNDSRVVSLYGHLRPSDPYVAVGDTVTIGQRIGTLGDSSENGGWAPHIHYGVHKEKYTGVWKYAGHVTLAAIGDKWYDPPSFLAAREPVDRWNPAVSFDLSKGDIVSDTFYATIYGTDLGSGIASVTLDASDDGKKSWEPIASYGGEPWYPTTLFTSLAGLQNGRVYLRATVTDSAGNSASVNTFVRFKAGADQLQHTVAVRGGTGNARASVRSQTGALLGEFRTDADDTVSVADVAVGDLTGNGAKNIVVIREVAGTQTVVILSKNGTQLGSFPVKAKRFQDAPRIAVGDLDGDGTSEIIVGSGPGKRSQVRVFKRDGTLVWKKHPFKRYSARGVDVAAGDMDGDGDDEVIVGMRQGGVSKVIQLSGTGAPGKVFRVWPKKYKGGVNVAAGDVDADGIDEIIVGSGGQRIARVRIVEPNGQKNKKIIFTPFGKSFLGPVDVSTTDWEEDGKAEIMVSQAGEGEAWVKTYRATKKKRIVTMQRVFEEGYELGARIAGW